MASSDEGNLGDLGELEPGDDATAGNVGATAAWVPLALTLVEYPKVILNRSLLGDIFGLLLALISLMPFAILAGFITLVLFRRDLHTIAFLGGITINEIVNLLLKHTIQEARPIRRDVLYSEYGMPSTHAQFMWFFAAYMTLFVLIRLHQNSNSTVSERFWRVLIIAACIALAELVTYSRIYLQYHSHSQVLCGAIIGIILGIIWFTIVHLVLTSYFPVIVTWKLSEYLLLRDTTLIPNVLWFEYTNVRTEARARSRKLVSMKSQ
ncbi:PREDICTED: dolichyldiphosphatase 1-like [Ceratosolen solmsi marchali]|uniref:Dolichyldiphosphatase n=1 Tax=Ceratosolen solmsi marchali TaxID=326594 RepID=A0AAJ7DWT2_9HYME|nr:PREDICTED: dolichyldiphosphatase 1-like [Ceratosolen solmsi marchali]